MTAGAGTRTILPAAALALGLLSLVFPPVSLPVMAFAVVAALLAPDRARTAVAVAGAVLSLAAGAVFAVRNVAPNLVGSGGRAAENAALSHLRELLWAQDLARAAPPAGAGRFETLAELTGRAPGVAPLQGPDWEPLPPTAGGARFYARGGYLFAVWLPGPDGAWSGGDAPVVDAAAARRWRAYAWPQRALEGSRRAFFIDQDDRICEAVSSPYEGAEHPPAAAALPEGAACTADAAGVAWTAWRHKKPRAPRP
jgi:hypothetical protein